MEKNIKVVVVAPQKNPEVKEIPNTLEAMQAIVGGYIETITLREGSTKGIILICNEEGKMQGLPSNRVIPEYRDIIVGTFFLTFGGLDSDFISLSDEQIQASVERFNL